jgi:23S rRNA (cytosine1962-C5)-methyltransferase
MNTSTTYELIDSGSGRKLERFGPYTLSRPCSQAVWKPKLSQTIWQQADAIFTRDEENRWIKNKSLPSSWTIQVEGISFKIQPTDFGHLGIFPEQNSFWHWIKEYIQKKKPSRSSPIKVLNLFAYSGGVTLAAALAGAEVCHLDASKGMVAWARENAALSGLEKAPIRWIVDDVFKFCQRELKRGHLYDAIVLDPPTFGRGASNELFKIEELIIPLLEMCNKLLTKNPLFILLSCHTPGFTPQVLHNLATQAFGHLQGSIDIGEMMLTSPNSIPIPSGTFARWKCD